MESEGQRAGEYLRLAKLYWRGRGGYPRDFEKAVFFYDQAAQLGELDALYQLGKCYLKGAGCLRDEGGAVSCFERAAHRGHHGAAIKLAECFRHGWGAPHNEQLACYWELRAQSLDQTAPSSKA